MSTTFRELKGPELPEGVMEEFLKLLPPELRLRGLSTEERLEGISTEERLEGLSTEELKRLQKLVSEKLPNAD